MKIVRERALPGLFLVLGLATSACGGSTTSGVDQSKELQDTTQAERFDICTANVNASYDAVSEQQYCKALALSGLDDDDDASELRADCQRLYDACLKTASKTLADNRKRQLDNCEASADDSAPGCAGVTVGQLETCFSDRIDQLLDRIAAAPECGELTSRDEVEYADGDVASCELIEDRCDDDD